MFLGWIDEGVAGNLPFQCRDADDSPIQPDAAPTFRVYGPNGLVAGGSGTSSVFESGVVNGATNASPIVISTTAAHGVTTGQPVTITGVGGNTNANGTFLATLVSSTSFSLDGSTGNAAYTSGGAWKTTGLFIVPISGAILAALEAGKTYTVIVTYEISGDERVQQMTFTVR